MEVLKSFFKSDLDPPHQEISRHSCYTDGLAKLPLELLADIWDLLSPIDLVCLCLCYRRLYTALKKSYQFPTRRGERLEILIRLERDLPGYFACDICNILHPYDGSESFGLSGIVHKRSSQLPCIRKGYDLNAESIGGSSISMRSHSTFTHPRNRVLFLQIKLAMRRYCYGPHFGINTDSLAYTQVREYTHPSQIFGPSPPVYQPIKTLFSIEAQICPKPLGVHVRMQDILLYDTWEDSKIQVNSKSYLLDYYELCQHTSLESKAFYIESIYNGNRSSFRHTCPRCNTVSLIEFCRVDSRLALVMTRWVNLGTGIRRDDPLWKIHIFRCDDWTMPSELPRSLTLQSPRKSFEKTTSLSFKGLRSRNISYLRGDRYKNGGPFDFEELGRVWHISYQDPQDFSEAPVILLLLFLFLCLNSL